MRPATDAVADTRYLVAGVLPTVDRDRWDSCVDWDRCAGPGKDSGPRIDADADRPPPAEDRAVHQEVGLPFWNNHTSKKAVRSCPDSRSASPMKSAVAAWLYL